MHFSSLFNVWSFSSSAAIHETFILEPNFEHPKVFSVQKAAKATIKATIME